MVNFNAKGNWQETEYEINMSDVPEKLKTVVCSQYPDYKIVEIEYSQIIALLPTQKLKLTSLQAPIGRVP